MVASMAALSANILQGRIRAGGIEKDVIFLDADPNLNAVKR
jgi:hypothetical protein